MPFRHVDSLRTFQFAVFDGLGLIQAVFTRRGGGSPAPWASLNVGSTVGDDPGRVRENKRVALDAVGRTEASLYEVWQVHSATIVEASAPRGAREPVQADGIITASPDVTLMMRFADCVPVVLYDPVRHRAGIVHAGWLGTVRGAAAEGVRAMGRAYGSQPGDLLAGIGPSICPNHYVVGPDVTDQVRAAFGTQAEAFLRDAEDGCHLDLRAANRWLLEREGVGRIEVADICTACEPADWYSHRGEHGRTGRFGAVVALAGG
jgi:hypothetical protein